MNIKPHTVQNKVAKTTYVVGRPNPSNWIATQPTGQTADTRLAGGTMNVSRITFLIRVTIHNFLPEDVTGVHV
jgi:hypothetical protein